MEQKTKTQIAVDAFNQGNFKEAFKHAKGFRIAIEQETKKAINAGYEAIMRPAFYSQLGKDPAELIEKAKLAFLERFINYSDKK
jgi:hypothetical protein